MKKLYITLALVLAAANSFAQEAEQNQKKTTTVSLNYTWGDPTLYGLAFEVHYPGEGRSTAIAKVSYATMNYKSTDIDVNGAGFAVELGTRTYGRLSRTGFYFENVMSYGVIDFNKDVIIAEKTERIKGTYSYWSLINPMIGFKVMLGKSFSIDPAVGFNWKWEIANDGDIHTYEVDNFVPTAGARLGYQF